MMNNQRGFVAYSSQDKHFYIDWQVNLSIIANDILMRSLLQARSYMRGRLLDVGCGRRPYGVIYDELVDSHIGTEVSFSPHGVMAADALSFAEHLPFVDASFDTILCTEVLEHTQQPFHALQEFARVLRPNGHLILSVPFNYPIHEAPHDYWRFTSYGLQQICQSAGLKVIVIHNKRGVLTYLAVLAVIFSVRFVNLLSKLLRQSSPLRERRWVRRLLSWSQYSYLWLMDAASKAGVKDDSAWLTIGYTIVAQRRQDAV